MRDLALAYVTCDNYSHVWDEWYRAYVEHWRLDLPSYFLGEEKECPFHRFKQIPHKKVTAQHWTSKLAAQVKKIPEKNIFVWLDDQIMQKNIYAEFRALYDWFVRNNADSLRIMSRGSAAHYDVADIIYNTPLYRLRLRSPYLVSYSPNIYTKEFLLRTLQEDESPWDAELKGTYRVMNDEPRRRIYAYHIDGWCVNRVIQ